MSDDQSPTAKKRKTMSAEQESTSSSPVQDITLKSDKMWFADGNIILETSAKRYRVHRGVLATHSSVFKDMFELPQPVEQPEVFEGCPVIRLLDSTDDWDELLPLFYNMRDLRDSHCLIDLHLMVAMLRLGQKYGCDRFKAQALEQLQRAFPSTLSQCKDMLEGCTTIDGASYGELPLDYEFYLLAVALELGIQTVLPLAFFTCLERCTTVQIFHGSYDAGPGRSGTLSSQTRETLLQAKDEIIADLFEKVYAWWKRSKPASQCTTKDACAEAIRKEAIRLIGIPTILEAISKVGGWGWTVIGICDACRQQGKSTVESAQRQIFDKLPAYFGLREWAALKNFEM